MTWILLKWLYILDFYKQPMRVPFPLHRLSGTIASDSLGNVNVNLGPGARTDRCLHPMHKPQASATVLALSSNLASHQSPI